MSDKVAIIALVSFGLTNFIEYVIARPIKQAISDVIKNITNVEVITFPNLLGCFILAMEVVIVRNISGTIITNNKLINKSPNGLNTAAFSPKISPIIAPIIKPINNKIVCL